MIATFVASGDKEWISATVTIDGTVFENVGHQAQGKFDAAGPPVDRYQWRGGNRSRWDAGRRPGRRRLGRPARRACPGVSGSTSSSTARTTRALRISSSAAETPRPSLNEAVALELIGAAGMATEEATPARFSVNGSAEALRLVIENPDDEWDDDNFDSDGILYKAEADGDYSYRGDDAAAYADIFSVEASDFRRGRLHPAHRIPEVGQRIRRRDLRRGARQPPRRAGLREVPRDPGSGREQRRHRRAGQQLLPALRRRAPASSPSLPGIRTCRSAAWAVGHGRGRRPGRYRRTALVRAARSRPAGTGAPAQRCYAALGCCGAIRC